MRFLVVIVAVVPLVLASGCSEVHEPDGDAAVADTNTDARDPCTVAGLRRCSADCGDRSVCVNTTTTGQECIAGLCLPYDMTNLDDPPCSELGECRDARNLCVRDSAVGGGFCMPESFCAEAAAEGYPLDCVWSGGANGGTPHVAGAPTDRTECPPAGATGDPFCGSPCLDACPSYGRQTVYPLDNRGSCVGRSDAHQFGLCVPSTPCSRGFADGAVACRGELGEPQAYPEFGTEECVCLVWRHADTVDGLSDFGFPASTSGCRAYRALYPDDFDCVIDLDWHTLP